MSNLDSKKNLELVSIIYKHLTIILIPQPSRIQGSTTFIIISLGMFLYINVSLKYVFIRQDIYGNVWMP